MFALASQRNERVHKQGEIDMPNTNPMLCVGSERIIVGPAKVRVGSARLFRYEHVSIPNPNVRGGYRISEREGGPGNY